MTIISALVKASLKYTVLENANFKALSHFLNAVSPMYPDFSIWWNFTFRRGLSSGQRKIVLAHYGDQIVGVALLKKNMHESKICTFYIAPDFREMGVGGELMDLALETLDSNNTFITVSDERQRQLAPLLSSRGFILVNSVDGLYRSKSSEHFYSL